MVNVTDSIIPASDFTTGRDYLIMFNVDLAGSSAAQEVNFRLMHGTTSFHETTESEDQIKIEMAVGSTGLNAYGLSFVTVWEAVAGEDVYLQGYMDGTATFSVSNRNLIAIEISEELTENTDWFYNANTSDEDLTTTWQTNDLATITFTPDNDGDMWLVMGQNIVDPGSNSVNYQTRLNSSGTINDDAPMTSREPEDSVEQILQFVMRAYILSDEEQTFAIQSRSDSGTQAPGKVDGGIFAMNLNKFVDQEFTWNEAEFSVTDTAIYSMEILTDTITPTSTGNFMVFAQGACDCDQATRGEYRFQSNNVDTPTTQTADETVFHRGYDPTDETQWSRIDIVSLTSGGARDLTIDGSKDGNAQNRIEDRLVGGFSLELVGGGDNCDPTCTQNLSDGLIIGDSIITETLTVQNDGLEIGDSITFAPTTVQNDGIIIGDSIATFLVTTTSQNDGIIFGDSLTLFLAQTQEGNDGIIFGDSLTLEITCDVTCQVNISDGLIIGDSLIKLTLINQTDGVIIGDNVITILTTNTLQNDGIIIGDSITLAPTTVQNDGIIIGDSVTLNVVGALTTNQNDGIIIGDTITLQLTCSVTCSLNLTDGIIIGDSFASSGAAPPFFNAMMITLNPTQNTTLGGVFAILCPTNSTLTGVFTNGTFRCTPMSDFFP